MICLTECWMWGYMRNTWRRCQDSLVYAPQTSAHLLWAQVFALQRTWAWCWVDGIEPVIVSCALVSTLWMILWLTRYMFYAYLYTYNESYICMYCMQNLVCFEGIRAIKGALPGKFPITTKIRTRYEPSNSSHAVQNWWDLIMHRYASLQLEKWWACDFNTAPPKASKI